MAINRYDFLPKKTTKNRASGTLFLCVIFTTYSFASAKRRFVGGKGTKKRVHKMTKKCFVFHFFVSTIFGHFLSKIINFRNLWFYLSETHFRGHKFCYQQQSLPERVRFWVQFWALFRGQILTIFADFWGPVFGPILGPLLGPGRARAEIRGLQEGHPALSRPKKLHVKKY